MSTHHSFAGCEWDPQRGRLLVGGVPAPLGGKAIALLRVLVERRAMPVSKGELLEAVWTDQDVEEGNLPVQISALRKVLGPHAIATVPGRGYQFMLRVEGDASPAATMAPAPMRLPSMAASPEGASASNAARPRHNLPAHAGPSAGSSTSPLIGRDDDLAALGRELEHSALVSVVGASGIGKTRLAAAAAAQRVGVEPDGVWWVELADVTDAAAMVGRIAAALGTPVEHAADPRQVVLQGLRARRVLTVLDNCEHLVEAVAQLVQAALEAAPDARWLVTSLEPLKLPAERVFRLGTLAVPPPSATMADALGHGALALLVERARAADRRFALTPASLPAAIEICRRLDGIPLALKMAAARLPWMGVDGVHDRLADRLRLLSGGRGERRHHRTLQATFDWSHGLLSPAERTVFRRLSVFRGGCSLAEAAAVVAAPGAPDALNSHGALDHWQAEDAIGALVEKSLVQVDAQTDTQGTGSARPRFRLLESARLYAGARLVESGEQAAVQCRHAEVMAAFAAEAWDGLWVETDAHWLARTEPEIDNLAAALRHAVEHGRAEHAAPIYGVLCWLAKMLGGISEVRTWAGHVETLAAAAAPPAATPLWLALGGVFRNVAPARAVTLYQSGLRASAALGAAVGGGAQRERLLLHCGSAIGLARTGQPQAARAQLDAASALVEDTWPARVRLVHADAAAFVALGAGDLRGAREHFMRFRALAVRCGADGALAVVSHNLADLALTLGEVDEAVQLGRELVARLRSERNAFNLGFALGNLCAALARQGDHAAAVEAAREALPLLRREQQAGWLFDHLALLAMRQGRLHDAARLQGHAEAMRRRDGSVPDPNEMRARDDTLAVLRARLAPSELEPLLREGEWLSAAEADALGTGEAPAVPGDAGVTGS